MVYPVITGMPGVGTRTNAEHRAVFRDGQWESFLGGGKIIDGSKSRDWGNTGALEYLRAGTLMGKITSSGKYAPSFIGVVGTAYASGTTLAVSAANAVEIVRRVGSSGTLKIYGPPTAAGVVGSETVTYSAANTSTGDLTITALGAAYVAGSLIGVGDGSEYPVTFLPDGWPLRVTDVATGNGIDIPFPRFPVAGNVRSSRLLPWPSDTALRAFICGCLNAQAGGKFVFDHIFG